MKLKVGNATACLQEQTPMGFEQAEKQTIQRAESGYIAMGQWRTRAAQFELS